MNKLISLAIAILLLGMPFLTQAQKTAKKPVKSKVSVKKKQRKPEEKIQEITDNLLSVEGDKNLYMGNKGDQLVYEVNAGGQTYNFIVTLWGPKTATYRYSFDWEMTAPVNKKGNVNISTAGAYDSRKYINFFKDGALTLTDACTVWMTGTNFAEMPDKKTVMQIDDNEPETFYRKDEAETEQKIIYKGKEIKLDIFKIDNDKTGQNHRQVWIQGISSFPLIVRMDMGWTIQLKEIK